MLIQKFIDYLKIEKGYSDHTIIAYHKDLESFHQYIEDVFDEKKLTHVTYIYIRSWIVELMETGHKPTSINRKMSALKSFYKFLMKTGHVEANPMVNHKALKQEKKIIIPFSQKEMSKLFDLMPEDDFNTIRDKLIVELLYTTGIRRAELIGLKQKDVDFSLKQIKVLGKRQKERIIPLLDNTIHLIRKYISVKNKISTSSDSLIINEKGNSLSDSTVYKIVKQNITLVSTKDKRSPHVLRHAFATHLLDEGLDLNTVKELLGHASLASTQVYTHSSLKKIKNVYQKSHPRNQ